MKIVADQYEWSGAAIYDCHIARYAKLPEMLREVILKYYRIKTEFKRMPGDPVDEEKEYMLFKAKAKLNAVYGMCATSSMLFCENGTEYVRLFVEENNDPEKLKYIRVWSMDTPDDMSIYAYDRMGSNPVDKETQKKMLFDGMDKYVKILYQYPY